MKISKIKCRRCDGKGEVDLDPILAGTLHLLKEFKSATAQDFFCHDENQLPSKGEFRSITAHNKRLERLRAAGLATRTQKGGRGWLYKPSK